MTSKFWEWVKTCSDSRAVKRLVRRKMAEDGKCSYCSPHGGKNVTRSKRGAKRPKHKNHRRTN